MSDSINADRAKADADQPQQTQGTTRRKLLLALLAAAIVAAGAAYGVYYVTTGQYHEATDNAYVSGNLVQLTPQVSGTVVAVNADDTQIVKQGAPVVTLDNADARDALANAEATLGQTVRQVSGLYVNNDYYAATVAQRESDLARAVSDLKRRQAVAETGAVSGEDVAHARDAVSAAQAALDAARQQAEANHALTDRTSIEQHPNVLAASSKVRDAYLNYARNTLPAPVTGYVARRSVQVGQRVAPGTPLMAIVPLNEVWVDANFKESQLRRMRIGQPSRFPPMSMVRASNTMAAWSASLREQARRSPYCPLRMRPATGSRSYSVCPRVFSSIRRNWTHIRCGLGCRCRSKSKLATSREPNSARR